MERLSENTVWNYIEEERGFVDGKETLIIDHFICNYGSKANFLRLIQSVKYVTPNWVKDRITMSSNTFQVSLSEKNPNSFIYYTTTRRWSEEGFQIKEIKTKPPTKSILKKKKKLDDAIADFIENNPDGEKIVSDLFNNKKK